MDGSLTAVQRRVLTALLACQRAAWEQGVAGHALLDVDQPSLVRILARDALMRQQADGRLGETGDNLVNCAANGEAVRALAFAGSDAAARGLQRQLTWLTTTAPRAADGTLFHVEGELWIDTVYMVVPLLVQLGAVDEAVRQLEGHRARLFDSGSELYGHRWDEARRQPIRAAHWGTGNGWVVAGLARALRLHSGPADELAGWAEHVRQVIDACVAHRSASGLFHDVVDDPGSFEEVNLAQMLAYAIGVGVGDGWLPSHYRGLGTDLLATAERHIDDDGFVFPVCGSPDFDRPGMSPEAQAFHLLASAALTAQSGL